QLEAAGRLPVLHLQVYRNAAYLRQRRRRHEGRDLDPADDTVAGGENVGDADGGRWHGASQRTGKGSVSRRPYSGLAVSSPHSRGQVQAVAWLLVTTGRPIASSIRAATNAERRAVHETNSASASGAIACVAASTSESGEIRAIFRSSSKPRQVKLAMSKPRATK